jgi:hypothetical protein
MFKRCAVAAVLLLGVVVSADASTMFTSKSAFIVNSGGHTILESFESLPATNSFTADWIPVSGFSMSTSPEANLGIFVGAQSSGLHPTEGAQYAVWAARPTEPSLTFRFEQPVHTFGATLTDALDGGIASAELRLVTDTGIQMVAASGAKASGGEIFVGLISDEPFIEVVLTVTAMPSTGDGIGVDEVRYRVAPVRVDGTVTADCGNPVGVPMHLALSTGDALTTATRPGFQISTAPDLLLGVFGDPYLDVHATHDGQYVLWSAPEGGSHVTISFDQPVTAFGVELIDALDGGIPTADLRIRTDAGDEMVVASGSRASGTEDFVGVVGSAPFSEVTLAISATPVTGDGIGIDGLRFGAPPALPTTAFFMDEASFIAATGAGLPMESFEFLPPSPQPPGNAALTAAISIPDGRYVFDGLPVPPADGLLSIEPLSGFAVLSPAGGAAPLALDASREVDFALSCITAVAVSGSVVSDCNGPLTGVPVDLIDSGGQIHSASTDGSGAYRFDDIPVSTQPDAAEISIAIPLGFEAASPGVEGLLLTTDQDRVVDFTVACLSPTGAPRGMGYWKHSADVYLSGRGNAQESLIDMSTNYPFAIFQHFHENALNGIAVAGVTYRGDPPVPLDLAAVGATLILKGNQTALARAKQEYLSPLLNIASGKLSTAAVVTADGGTASQVIQYMADLLNDGDPTNDSAARALGETINSAQLVEAGAVPLQRYETIAYARSQLASAPLRVSPNPGGGGPYSFSFAMSRAGRARLEIYGVRGRLVAVPLAGSLSYGRHVVTWRCSGRDARPVAKGLYFARLTTSDGVKTIKFLHVNG